MTASVHFIHGMTNTHLCFAYLAKELGYSTKLSYTSHQPLEVSLAQISKVLPKTEPIILVGHSLGGVIASLIALEGRHNIQKIVTISSPLAGSKAAVFARWMMPEVMVLKDITPTSPRIQQICQAQFQIPVLSIVSTAGNLPIIGAELNDSVVTIASQKAIKAAKKVEIKVNHMEVLNHDKTVECIRKFIEI
jgi:pimeloyl-ACP methyl ester carboxylesterase